MIQLPSRSTMERAYLTRDAAYDGVFFTAVRTTKIFCRPTCPARKPFPKNVEFFQTAQAAQAAGYRACKRCHPLEPHGHPEWVVELLHELSHHPERKFKDADLKARGVDPTTVRRYFVRTHRMSFHAFCRLERLAQARDQIHDGVELETVIFQSGYESHSGFRQAYLRVYGETPGSVQITMPQQSSSS